jgi:pseudouridine kinase
MTLSDSSAPTHGLDYVLAVGGANMDIVGTAHSAWLMGDSNPGSVRCAPGGVARNVAENLARLGHTTHLLSAVGDDAFGRSLLDATRTAGVHTGACSLLAQYNTSTYLSLHGHQGDLTMAVNDMDIVNSLTPQFLSAHAALISQASVVFADCNLSADALAWLLSHTSGKVWVDAVSTAKCQRIRPYLQSIHLLKVNLQEAQTLSGHPCSTPADMQANAQWLHAQGVQQVLISLGARGMFYSDATAGHGWQNAVPSDVVNVNGAGDALLAGWMHAMLSGTPLAQAACFADAARFAQACAALTVGCVSANHPGLSVAAVTKLLTDQTTTLQIAIP